MLEKLKKIIKSKPAEKWVNAQKGEFNHHSRNEWRKSGRFLEDTAMLLRSFHYHPLDFKDKIILDVGAGSKLRTKFFTDAKIVALEPLAEKFMNEIEWCDLKDAYCVYSLSAEDFIQELEGRVDFIFCLNVLDHTYDPGKILENCKKYLKPDGQILLSVDLYWKTNKLHPVKFDRGKVEKMMWDAGFGIERAYLGLFSNQSYGLGETYTMVARPCENPEDFKLISLTGFGENARHLRFMTGQLTLIGPYKIVRDLVVRADRKFRRIFGSYFK